MRVRVMKFGKLILLMPRKRLVYTKIQIFLLFGLKSYISDAIQARAMKFGMLVLHMHRNIKRFNRTAFLVSQTRDNLFILKINRFLFKLSLCFTYNNLHI